MDKEKLVKYLVMMIRQHEEIIFYAEGRGASKEFTNLHKQSVITLQSILDTISEGEFDEEI